MRKGLLAALAIVLGLVIAAPVFAADLSVGGYIGTGFRLYRNLYPEITNPVYKNGTIDTWMQRADLSLNIKTSDTLGGKVRFFVDSFPNPWGTAQTGQNALGKWGAEQVTVEVKEAYVDFKIPGIQAPTFARVGVQYFDIRPWVFLTVPGAGIALRSSCDTAGGKVTVGAGWGKIREYDEYQGVDEPKGIYVVKNRVDKTIFLDLPPHQVYQADEERVSSNMYYALMDYKGKNYGLGLYAASVFAEGVWKDVNIMGWDNDKRKYASPVENGYRGDMKIDGNVWWLGLYSDGKVGPVNYQVDFIYDFGDEKIKVQALQKTIKIDYSGWLARAVLTYPYEKFNFGLGGLYVSGEDFAKLDNFKNYKSKVKGFVLPAGAETLGPAGDSLIVVSGWGAGPGPMCDVGLTTNPFNFTPRGTGLLAQEGWGGIWGVRLFADYKALDWLKLAAQVAYWGDTSKKGDTFEYLAVKSAKGTDKDEKSIGVEVDLGAQISLYKNLNIYTAFGYLFAGKAIDMKETGKKADDPYAFVVNLMYTF